MNQLKIYQNPEQLLFDREISVVRICEFSKIFDESQARLFRKQINDSLKKGTNIFIVNLKNVTFMNSLGLAGLAQVHKRVQAAGGKLFFVSISEPVRMLFELTSVDSVFEIIGDRAQLNELLSEPSTKAEYVKEYATAPSS